MSISKNKKLLVAAAVSTLTISTAVPAMALENEFHGLLRLKSILSNTNNYGSGDLFLAKDAKTNFYNEQRSRLFYTAKASDDLKAVLAFEIDSRWGDAAYANGRNQGGGLEADTVNIETKNVYLDFRVPATPMRVKAGIQGFTDAYKGIYLGGADTAGLVANGKLGDAEVTAGWLRFWDVNEGGLFGTPSVSAKQASVNTYLADAKFTINKDLTVGGSYYLLTDTTGNAAGGFPASSSTHKFANGANNSAIGAGFTYDDLTMHMLGVNASTKIGPATIDGFVIGQYGTFTGANGALGLTARKDVDVFAFAANVRAQLQIGLGTAKVEALFVSGDDLNNDTYSGFVTGSQYNNSASTYSSPDMQLLLPNKSAINTSSAVAYDVNNKSQGLIGGFIGYDTNLTDKLYANANAGFMAVAKANANKPTNNSTGAKNKSDYLGTEINAEVGYKLYPNLTTSVQAAYLVLGDYYKGTGNAAGGDPDNPYTTRIVLSYAF